MQPINPYDRRGPRGDTRTASEVGFMGVDRQSGPLRIEDLEAMVNSAYARGAAATRSRMTREAHAERAQVWEEGRQAGEAQGAEAQWRRMSDAITAAIPRDLVSELPGEDAPERLPDRYSNKRVAPTTMWRLLRRCRAVFELVGAIETAHMPDAARDVPF